MDKRLLRTGSDRPRDLESLDHAGLALGPAAPTEQHPRQVREAGGFRLTVSRLDQAGYRLSAVLDRRVEVPRHPLYHHERV
jgi:hypothetical protein